MNGRVFAALFVAIFFMGALPMLLVQPPGVSSAWLTLGFRLPIDNPSHVLVLVMLGMIAGWLGGESMALLPLSALLMLIIGAMLQMDQHPFPALQLFLAGAIMLFALGVSTLRRSVVIFSVLPASVWAYFIGAGYMASAPAGTNGIYFLMGLVISALLVVAMGVSLGAALKGTLRYPEEHLRGLERIAAMFSLF
jgi:urease accessory protein